MNCGKEGHAVRIRELRGTYRDARTRVFCRTRDLNLARMLVQRGKKG